MNINDSLKQNLELEEKQIFLSRYKFAALYFATPLVLSFSAVDYFFAPQMFIHFFLVRLSIIPVALITYMLCKSEKFTAKWHTVPALIGIFYFGVFHAYLVTKSGYEVSTYYSGINLATVVFFTFLPWPPKYLPFALVFNHLPYMYAVVFHGNLNYQFLVPHISFMASISFICVVAFFVTRKLRTVELKNRMDLKKLTEVQAQIIDQKTKEGVYLEKLTAQFSPQIIEGIRNGRINLDAKIRKEVSCIFIDIVNSTNRSVRIDHQKYSSIISDFFSECINIFLKHNVTIGTYLGDGIMAFVNAPQDTDEHEKVAYNACLEILKFYETKKKYYSTNWKSEFNIRIGINTGFAHLGFFPSIKRGTYTAIGETVNLASRLCSVATLNSICVTKNFVLKITDELEKVNLKKLEDNIVIKGFEEDSFELFCISPKDTALLDEVSRNCPLCSGIMIEVSTFDNCMLTKCSKCNYTDIEDANTKKPAA